MAESVDPTPLLEDSSRDSSIKPTISECKLQEKCFLSEGAARGSTDSYKKVQRKLVIACILCFIFMTVEVIGGYIAKSVAIMSDAAHMLSDVSAFLVSIFATWAATQPSTWHYSFGYHRAEILGALISVLTIWAVTGALVFEAFQRTINPVRVDGKLMFIISIAGVVFNILIMLTLGVHAHLGHSHGPDGGCSHGHSHGHDHDHEHDHEHKHEHGGHGHSHGSCNHSHSHGSKHGSSQGECNGGGDKAHTHGSSHGSSKQQQQQSSGCGSHKHEEGGEHQHGHHHDHEREHSHTHEAPSNGNQPCSHGHSHSHDSSNSDSDSDHEAAHNHSHCNHEHGSHSHGDQAAAAGAAGSSAAAGQECVVITVPGAAVGGGSGLACTISKTGSREIEVRCELPVPAAAAAAAQARPRSHSHAGQGHSQEHSHEHDSINLRGAVLHVIGDLLQSIGVAIAGGLIWLHQDDPRWYLADPICTFVFSIVVLLTTKSILRDIVHVLMERTPPNMDVPAVARVMLGMEGVWDIHDLHIWAISTSMKPVLTAHVHIGPDADANVVLQQLEAYVRGLGIDHSTIQICNIAAPPQLDQPAQQAEV